MELKDMQDLNIMPALPDEDPPAPPAGPETTEAPRTEEPRKAPERKKRRSLLPGILAGVAVAAVVLCGYRFVHIWSDASCESKARCSICGLEKEGYAAHTWNRTDCETPAVCAVCGETDTKAAGHNWTGGSCTEVKICADCGAEQLVGHSYAQGVCAVCGAAQENGVLKWETGSHTLQYSYQSETGDLVMENCSLNGFVKMSITIKNWNGEAVSTDGYTISRSDTAVTIHMPKNLEQGSYTIHAGVQDTQVLRFWWGTTDEWMPEDPDQWYSDFKVQNRKQGLWLAGTEDGAAFLGVQTEEEASRFESPWRMLGNDKYVIDGYVRFDENGQEEFGCIFRYGSGYLAMDAGGRTYLSDTLVEECFWSIPSFLG